VAAFERPRSPEILSAGTKFAREGAAYDTNNAKTQVLCAFFKLSNVSSTNDMEGRAFADCWIGKDTPTPQSVSHK